MVGVPSSLVVKMKIHWTDMYDIVAKRMNDEVCTKCENNIRCTYYPDSPVESVCDECEVELSEDGEFYCTKYAEE